MGPITGFRIINLRAQDKVAYPDLTIDLIGGNHTVVGLENGGGKSTLIGFLIHVLFPDASEFLPRRAKRRQSKKGEDKRIENYVPGGPPTHVILEFELPHRGAITSNTPTRVLIGACLYKPAGSGPTVKAKEFFWSVRCTGPGLTLADLPIRNGDTLLDHQEWRHQVNVIRDQIPSAEATVYTDQAAWEGFLKDVLKIDVGFVRSWLLTMNEDEGAADRVFTYASSREFLNSLVEAIADPRIIIDIKQTLRVQAAEADSCKTDRRRKRLLEQFVTQISPLAELSAQLTAIDAGRRQLVDGTIGARLALRQAAHTAKTRAETAQALKEDAEAKEREAAKARSEALAMQTAARLQAAQLGHQRIKGEIKATDKDIVGHETLSAVCSIAVGLAEQASVEARMKDAQRLLEAKSTDAESVRRSASSAVQAWVASLEHELADLDDQLKRHDHDYNHATAALSDARSRHTNATSQAASLATQIENRRKRLAELEDSLEQARASGLLSTDQLPTEALAELTMERKRLNADFASAEAELADNKRHFEALSAQTSSLERKIGSAASAAKTAHQHLLQVTQAAQSLAADLEDSNLLDLPSVSLDDNSPMILELLNGIIDSAHRRTLSTAVEIAATNRAAKALQDTRLMPPRPDIERLCEMAIMAGLGARSGWSYLALTPSAVAADHARLQPALADGIVVNVPDDLPHIRQIAEAQASTLTGPVCIGPPSAFTEPGSQASIVVLPDASYWSFEAADQQRDRCAAEQERQQAALRAETNRQKSAQILHDRLTRWCRDLGPGAINASTDEHRTCMQEHNELLEQAEQLTQQIAEVRQSREAAEVRTGELRSQINDASIRYEQLSRLNTDWNQRPSIEAELTAHTTAQQAAVAQAKAADADMVEAEGKQKIANDQQNTIEIRISLVRQELVPARPIHAELVRPGDEIEADDAAANREMLAALVDQRFHRYRGAITDSRLEAEIEHCRKENQRLARSLADKPRELIEAATVLLTDEPTETPADFNRKAEAARDRVGDFKESRGELRQQLKEQDTLIGAILSEAAKLPACRLDQEEITNDLAIAETVAQRWTDKLTAAEREHSQTERAKSTAVRHSERTTSVHRLIIDTHQRLHTALEPLTTQGPLLASIDVEDIEFTVTTVEFDHLPGPLTRFIIMLTASDDYDIDALTAAASTAIHDLVGLIDVSKRKRETAERKANQQLEAVEATLRGADEEIRSGDQMMQMINVMHRTHLFSDAVTIHQDAANRLALLTHKLEGFDEKVATTAKAIFAHLSHVLAAVRQTARDSQLPDTPALGAWKKEHLLKFGGLDMTKADQEAHILATMREWFDPDRTERPNFDANTTIFALLAAITPRFTAQLLIPSDPLDPKHKPVEKIAQQTSGGEGVTIALLLAALLAARRSKNNGHQRTTLILDNPFSKVTKPLFLRLVRDVASSLGVRVIAFTGIRDVGALSVFPAYIGLRVSRRQTANVVAPHSLDDDELQELIREGTLYVSPIERDAVYEDGQEWPVVSVADITYDTQLQLSDLGSAGDNE